MSALPALALLWVGLTAAGPEQVPPPGTASVSNDRATVVYWPGDSARAGRILRLLERRPDLPALPSGIPTGVEILLPPSEATLDSLTGGLVPEWGAGVAIPALNRILLPSYTSGRSSFPDEARVLFHEWAHVGLHQRLGDYRVPRWFDEGYAEWASGGWNATEAWKLRIALATGRAPPLDSLDLGWPAGRETAGIAYMLAASAVEYLVAASGERALGIFIERWAADGRFEEALRSTYGITGGQLEEDWRKYVQSRYGWLVVLSHSLVFWSILGLLLTGMVIIRIRRNRLQMARLRAKDEPDAPAYWMDGQALEKTSLPPGPRVSDGGGGGSWRIVLPGGPREESGSGEPGGGDSGGPGADTRRRGGG